MAKGDKFKDFSERTGSSGVSVLASSEPLGAAGGEVDDDGYPTEETLRAISAWPLGKFAELMECVRTAWHFREWGWDEEETADDEGAQVRRYRVSTAGWSGNESLIAAMQDNCVFWLTCWVQSRRGGHYIFEIRHQ